jgi:hypothetical protein
MQGAEDVNHLLFHCATSKEIWSSLGIAKIIEEAFITDRSGSAVLEHLLRDEEKKLPGFENIGQKETIGVACWYLWWIHRRRTHDESVPPMSNCQQMHQRWDPSNRVIGLAGRSQTQVKLR